jgi:DNA polymerase-3 subunit alpha
MYLFFDTSANGSPKNWKAPINDPFNWPRMIQLSWLAYNEERELINSRNDIIKPKGFTITEEIEKKYHLNQEKSIADGVDIKEALMPFAEAIKEAKYVISFNQTFNNGVIGAELYRASINHILEHSNNYCLMQEATWFCKLKGKGPGYKWPSLQEIHKKIYNAEYEHAGEAQADVAVTALSFFHLLDLEAIEIFD